MISVPIELSFDKIKKYANDFTCIILIKSAIYF
jgi:hypothetical protein